MKKEMPNTKSTGKLLSTIMLSLASVFLFFAQTAFWLNQTIFDKPTFTSTAQTALLEESSREAIATAVVDKALADKPVVRRVVGDRAISLLSSILGTDLSSQAVSRLIGVSYGYMTTSDRKDISIDLTAIKTPLSGAISIAENSGRDISVDPTSIPDEVVLVKSNDYPDLSGYLKASLWLAPFLWLGTIASFSLYIYFGRSMYAKKVYCAGLAIIGVSVVGLFSGPFIPPSVASLVDNIDLRVVVENVISAFLKPYQAQMYTTIAVTLIALTIFNQRFNILSLVKNLEHKITRS